MSANPDARAPLCASGGAAAPRAVRAEGRRVRGLALLFGLVALGMLPTSVYFHWKVPGVVREFQALIDAAPRDPEARLDLWYQMNGPQVHNRLAQFRLSAEQPWLVTHAVGPADPQAQVEVTGIDFSRERFTTAAIRRRGMAVEVELAAPESFGRAVLRGLQAHQIPRYADAASAPDATERVFELVEYALRHPDDFLQALVDDNPGASFRLRVGSVERALAESAPAPGESAQAPGESAPAPGESAPAPGGTPQESGS